MKTKSFLPTLVLTAFCLATATGTRAQDIDSMAPVVVKTVPEAGSKNVSPGEMEIRVTFSKDMMDQSWSWSTPWKDSDAPSVGKPHYDATRRTCILKVKLEPNKTYGYWLNSPNFHGFKDAQGHAAVAYLLVFQTKSN